MRKLNNTSTAILWLSWCIFLASFFLPAYDGLERPGAPPGTPLLGWQAMVYSLVVLTVKFWVVFSEPRFLLFYILPLGNVFVILSPMFAMRLREDGWPIILLLIAFSAAMWIMPFEMYDHTLYGFWIWNLAPLAMAISIAMNYMFSFYNDPQMLEIRQNHGMNAESPSMSNFETT